MINKTPIKIHTHSHFVVNHEMIDVFEWNKLTASPVNGQLLHFTSMLHALSTVINYREGYIDMNDHLSLMYAS